MDTTTRTAESPSDFICGIRGAGHSSFADGLAWIELSGGVQVSDRPSTIGGRIQTWRVRFPGADVLVTWGYPGLVDQRSGVTFPPEWRTVTDSPRRRAECEKLSVHPAYKDAPKRTECR